MQKIQGHFDGTVYLWGFLFGWGGGGVRPPVIASCTIPLHLFHRRIRFPAWRGQWCVSSGRRRCVLDRLFGVCVRFALSGSSTKRRPFTDIYFHFKKKRAKVKENVWLKTFSTQNILQGQQNTTINQSIDPFNPFLLHHWWYSSDGSEQSVSIMEWGHFMTNASVMDFRHGNGELACAFTGPFSHALQSFKFQSTGLVNAQWTQGNWEAKLKEPVVRTEY